MNLFKECRLLKLSFLLLPRLSRTGRESHQDPWETRADRQGLCRDKMADITLSRWKYLCQDWVALPHLDSNPAIASWDIYVFVCLLVGMVWTVAVLSSVSSPNQAMQQTIQKSLSSPKTLTLLCRRNMIIPHESPRKKPALLQLTYFWCVISKLEI